MLPPPTPATETTDYGDTLNSYLAPASYHKQHRSYMGLDGTDAEVLADGAERLLTWWQAWHAAATADELS